MRLKNFLSIRVRKQLNRLEASLSEAARARNQALRVVKASRSATVSSASRDFWLEYAWHDQEYRWSVRQLQLFCADVSAQLREKVTSTIASRDDAL
jgi:hypothetical protein